MTAAGDLEASGLHGFVTVAHLQGWARSESLEGFCRQFPSPCLRVIGMPASLRSEYSPPVEDQAGRQTLFQDDQVRADPNECSAYAGQVGFLSKRPGNPFPDMVSVGRAPNTDLVISVSSVSKLHGYFLCQDGAWQLSDYSSTNGIFVNGERLALRVAQKLSDGDLIKFGLDMSFQFLLPAKLYTVLRDDSLRDDDA